MKFLVACGLVLALNAASSARLQPAPGAAAGLQPNADGEWIPLGSHGGRSLVHRSAPLTMRNAGVRRALVIVHGGAAGAAANLRIGLDAAREAGLLDSTLVVAPRIPSNDAYVCNDALDEGEINWGCQANNGWPAGGTAMGDDTLTSYDLLDVLLRRIASKRVFPNLASIVVAGHSAGGQFTVRYAMANRVHDTLGVRVAYVVANPAHYPYPDPGRPVQNASVGCRIWNDWPYGLQDRVGYTARMSEDQLRTQLTTRPVTYLLGDRDTLTTGGLDTTCAAMAQGPFRFARGQNFVRYVNEKYHAKHVAITVPGCGHDQRCMLTAAVSLPVLFK
jgi:pimeloyl-ACP methyl ester carboxylesterase